jgi:glycerol dehydrogenase
MTITQQEPVVPAQVIIGPRRYVQGRGVMAKIGEYLAPLGEQVMVLADSTVWGLVETSVRASLTEAGVSLHYERFGGECSAREIDRVAGVIRSSGVEAIAGVGGGKTLDAAKAAGHLAGVAWASVPTVASTDAPTSALSVVYTDGGAFEEYRFFPHNPDVVIVDTELAANAPYRFLVSGMGDALATWVEARAASEARAATMAGGVATMAGLALARLCWDTLLAYGPAAREAARHHVVTAALEKTVEANTLLSGLGFESGGLAAAHAVHNGLTAVPHTHAMMHGEKVNFGTLTQFAMEDRPGAEIDDLVAFSVTVGLPATLTEIGLGEADLETLSTVARAATAPGETIHNMPFTVTAKMTLDAMVAADAYAMSYRERHGLGPPSPPSGH